VAMAKVAPLEFKQDGDPRGSTISQVGDRLGEYSASVVFRVQRAVRQTGWYESRLAESIRKLLHGRIFNMVTMTCLLIALFFCEIWKIFQVSTNTELDIILTVVFAVFAMEFIGLCLTDASYLFGFFFWMDILGTLSMVFDISFMAGSDVTEAYRVSNKASNNNENVTVVRAARAARLGARAGRISRMLKILRFLPFLFGDKSQDQVKIAKVISAQLTNVLSTRVAFLTICIVIVLPFLAMFAYPEVDDSMAAWAGILNQEAKAFNAALLVGDANGMELWRNRLKAEVARVSAFYSTMYYGPFSVQYGSSSGDSFIDMSNVLNLQSGVAWDFDEPRRKSSIRIVTEEMIQISFNLAVPSQQEAGAAMGLIIFVIVVMLCFGMIMSHSIGLIALQPLERMLSVVRQRCAQIFKYTNELEEDDSDEESRDAEEYTDIMDSSEFALLEQVVKKLALIAHLSTANQEPEVKEGMNETEIMVLNWMQGAQVPTGPKVERSTKMEDGVGVARMESSLDSLPSDLVEGLKTANFNALDLPKECKISIAAYMMLYQEGSSAWVRANIRESHLLTFLNLLESRYMPNPFHNFSHAVDVQYTVARYLRLIEGHRFLSEMSMYWLLVAAIGHDVGHLGVNNQYLIETSHELALRYNDHSPLENMHCAKLFQTASEPEALIFSQLAKDTYKEMRKGIIMAVLHTDVTKHNEMIKDMCLLYQMNSEAFDALDPGPAVTQSQANLQLVTNMCLHGADVGNPTKPWELCHRQAYLCIDEFFAQGELEKAAGIPVQMLNDKDKVNRPNSQVGFIEFVISPMVVAMVNLFPQLDSLASSLGHNIQRWSEVWQEEHKPPADAVSKVEARVKKVVANMQGVMRAHGDKT